MSSGENPAGSDLQPTLPAPSSPERPLDDLLKTGALMPPVRPGLGANLDRYEVLGELGRGGMGVVLLARDPRNGERVAVKMLKPELANQSTLISRFLVEARHMRHLSHHRILPVLEVSDRAEGPYFVVPYMERGSVATLIRRGEPLDYEMTLGIARDIAEALAFAHRKGIIHRDLKPANVLVDGEGHAYLADFGLLRTVFNDSFVDVRKSQREGTAAYMSPAVAAGQGEDTRCDIYSFGAMLYELLTGEPPYTGDTHEAIIAQILSGPPAPISKRNPKAPTGLVRIAEAAMARELRDRYATMTDVLADLDRLAAGQTPLGPHGKPRPMRRLFWAALFVCIPLAVGVAFVQRLSWDKVVPDRQGLDQEKMRAPVPSRPSPPPTPPLPFQPSQHQASYASSLRVPVEVVNSIGMRLALIPPGTFRMGASAEEIRWQEGGVQGVWGHYRSEAPQHDVQITRPFYMAIYETTQAQFQLVMGRNPSSFRQGGSAADRVRGQDTDQHPVETLAWNDAVEFCKRLSALAEEKAAGRMYRLPTEAEWEYACRAGTTTWWSFGAEETRLADYAWFQANSGAMTHPVGRKKPNAWGLYDMCGNAHEWCSDGFAEDYYQRSPPTDPAGPIAAAGRVFRGGDYDAPPSCTRSAFRGADDPSSRFRCYGVRVVCFLPDSHAATNTGTAAAKEFGPDNVQLSGTPAVPPGGQVGEAPPPAGKTAESLPAPMPNGELLLDLKLDPQGVLPTGWMTRRGKWSVADGELRAEMQETSYHGVIFSPRQPWRDYAIECEMRLDQGIAGVVFRHDESDRFYGFHAHLKKDDSRYPEIARVKFESFRRHEDPAFPGPPLYTDAAEFGQANFDVPQGRFCQLRIEVVGPHMSAWIDGKRVLTGCDKDGTLTHGGIGFLIHDAVFQTGRAAFRSVKVWSLTTVPPQPRVVGEWTLFEGQGKTAADVTGVGNDATLHGGATWGDGWDMAKKAVYLDGQSGYLSVPHGASQSGLKQLTVRARFRLTSLPEKQTSLISKMGPGDLEDDAFHLYLARGGRLYIETYRGTNLSDFSAFSDPLPLNQWVEAIATYDGLRHTIWVRIEHGDWKQFEGPELPRERRGYALADVNVPIDIGGDPEHGLFLSATIDFVRILAGVERPE